MLGNRFDAEDTTQETFIKVYKNLVSCDPEREFSPWLYKIATNTAYDCLRKKQGNRELSFEDLDIEILDSKIETINASKSYKLIEEANDTEIALSRLKPIHKAVLLLYYRDDLSYASIAETLQLPMNTVKTHISRAKKELKKYYAQ